MDNEGSKTISSQTTVSRGDPTHLLLGPTNALQVADQSLLALLQSLLQVLKGCTYLGQGLCLALLQLLADAPNQGDSCRQLWQSEEVKHLIPGWLEGVLAKSGPLQRGPHYRPLGDPLLDLLQPSISAFPRPFLFPPQGVPRGCLPATHSFKLALQSCLVLLHHVPQQHCAVFTVLPCAALTTHGGLTGLTVKLHRLVVQGLL